VAEFVAMVVQRYGAGGEYGTTRYPIDHPGAQAMPVEALEQIEDIRGVLKKNEDRAPTCG